MVFNQYATELHIELHLICSIACALCHAIYQLNRTCIILDCASCHVDVLVVYYVVCFLSCVCFFGLVPVTSRLWGPIRLRPFVFFMDSFFFLAGSQARWPYPWNHFYLCLLVARSFAMPMLWCLPLAFKPPKFPCQTSNPPCPSKPLIGYVTALLSPSYSVASCRWRLESVPCWNIIYLLGYHYIILLS